VEAHAVTLELRILWGILRLLLEEKHGPLHTNEWQDWPAWARKLREEMGDEP
jgi:hypothetical protein